MLPHERFRINPSQIAHETFDAEVLAINLDTGTYFSLPGASSRLWALVAQGESVGAIVRYFELAHTGDPGVVAGSVTDFLARLQAERLIVPDESALDTAPAESAVSTAPTPIVLPFQINVYTDMQDLLLLDPIHDVEDSGWPVGKPQALGPAGS